MLCLVNACLLQEVIGRGEGGQAELAREVELFLEEVGDIRAILERLVEVKLNLVLHSRSWETERIDALCGLLEDVFDGEVRRGGAHDARVLLGERLAVRASDADDGRDGGERGRDGRGVARLEVAEGDDAHAVHDGGAPVVVAVHHVPPGVQDAHALRERVHLEVVALGGGGGVDAHERVVEHVVVVAEDAEAGAHRVDGHDVGREDIAVGHLVRNGG